MQVPTKTSRNLEPADSLFMMPSRNFVFLSLANLFPTSERSYLVVPDIPTKPPRQWKSKTQDPRLKKQAEAVKVPTMHSLSECNPQATRRQARVKRHTSRKSPVPITSWEGKRRYSAVYRQTSPKRLRSINQYINQKMQRHSVLKDPPFLVRT